MLDNEPVYPVQEETGLLDYIGVILKYRRLIFFMCGVSVIIAIIVSLRLPEIYSATTVIMPPNIKKGAASALTAKLGGFASLAGGMLGEPADIYVDMLNSRTVVDAIIRKFEMMKVYGVGFMEDARRVLRNSTNIRVSKANTIGITVEDKKPQRAADLANAYVEELDKLGQRFNVSDAARQRIFLDKRIEETKKQLIQAEGRLKKFQEQNKIVALTEQARTSIYAAARIKGQIVGIETDLTVLKSFVTGKSNKIIRLEQRLAELKEQLVKIETGHKNGSLHNPGNPEEDSNFYIPFNQVPDLGLRLGRFMREVKIQETVFEFLTQQYEMVKIAEAKDTSTIQVLDKAIAPEGRTKPRRTRIVALSGIVTFLVAIFLAFVVEFFKKIKPEDKKRWQEIKAGFGLASSENSP